MAYIVLPKDISAMRLLPADWTEDDFNDANRDGAAVVGAVTQKSQWTDEDFEQANRAVEEVVRAVRAEKFWPPASRPPAFSEEFAAICQDAGSARRSPPQRRKEGTSHEQSAGHAWRTR